MMSKKILIMLVAVVTGVFMASVAMAIDYGQLGYDTANAYTLKTAGTVLNPEGKGDLLIAPYYDVRVVNGKAQDTYFAIINENIDGTTNAGVAAKLRFREWDKSEEVLDFDIWMSENDVWVGVLTRNPSPPSGNGLTRITSPDYIITGDTTTTFTVSKTTAVSTGFDFFSLYAPGGAFNTKAPPTGFTAADLTNMGYFEIIGEERTASKPVGTSVTRLAAGWDCPNSLSAYVYIVRVDDGVSMGYNATAIANFSRQEDARLYKGPGDVRPDLYADAEDGLDQLEFELSKAQVYHGYSIEDTINGKFSLIVTFPTKHHHFGLRPSYTVWGEGYGLPFTGANANYGEVVDVKIYNRDETLYALPPGEVPPPGWWSPQPPPGEDPEPTIIRLPWEVNVIGLYKGTVPSVPLLGNRDNVAFTTGGFQTGWMWIDLYKSVHYAEPLEYNFGHLGNEFARYNGMPALSLALQEFENLTLAAGGYYGAIFPAYYKVDWTYYVAP